MTNEDPAALAAEAAQALRDRLSVEKLDLAFVLGSGWSAAADELGRPIGELALAELPGFAAPVVAGHGGALRLYRTATGKTAAVFTGRTHFYEGRGVAAVVHGVRTAAAAGADTLVLTNGCGGLNPDWAPGTPVLIRDHLNLTGATPLVGATFVDLTDAYAPRLRELARTVDPTLAEGVYVQFRGPQYETPAEVRMAGILGGDLVGMSTALEAIAARAVGLEVLGISLVTNLGAGISPTPAKGGDPLEPPHAPRTDLTLSKPLHHAEVIEAGRAAEPRLRALLGGLAGVL